MARPPFTFDRNTLGSNGSFPLRSMAGPPFEGSQLKNIGHFTAMALRRDNPLCRSAADLSKGLLGLAVLRAVDGSFGARLSFIAPERVSDGPFSERRKFVR